MVMLGSKKYMGPRLAKIRRRIAKSLRKRFYRMPKKTNYGFYKFKEVCDLTSKANVAAGPGLGVGGVFNFQLLDLFNLVPYSNLFDMFKITGVKLKFIFGINSGQVIPGSVANQTGLPILTVSHNHDPNIGAPTSLNDILNDDSVKNYRTDRVFNVYIKNPTPQIVDVSGNVIPIYQNISKQNFWLCTNGNGSSIDQTTVKHYGLRWWLDNSFNSTTSVSCKVYATYYFSMKERD